MAIKTEETRLIRAGVYVEMDLYDAANKAAADSGLSLSSWARKVMLEKLVASNHITPEVLLRLASAGVSKTQAA